MNLPPYIPWLVILDNSATPITYRLINKAISNNDAEGRKVIPEMQQ